jgi:hypothetical protein
MRFDSFVLSDLLLTMFKHTMPARQPKFVMITSATLFKLGRFCVMRICSRTRDWPACVAPAKNNFICVFIVKRDKRMRSAVEGVTPLRSVRMRERAYNFSDYFRVGRGARTVLYLRLSIR